DVEFCDCRGRSGSGEQGENLQMGEGVLERASSLLRRRRVRQLHDGRRRGSHPRDVREELRPSGEDQEALRSGEPVPRKSEHQAEMKAESLVTERWVGCAQTVPTASVCSQSAADAPTFASQRNIAPLSPVTRLTAPPLPAARGRRK